jgi:hypothetical protein
MATPVTATAMAAPVTAAAMATPVTATVAAMAASGFHRAGKGNHRQRRYRGSRGMFQSLHFDIL